MQSKIIKQLKEKERTSFLKLDPVDRILQMEKTLYEIISAKAAEEGVTEGEIYKRYLESNKKHRHSV